MNRFKFDLYSYNAKSKIHFMSYTNGTSEIKKYIYTKLKLFNTSIEDESFKLEIEERVSSPILISKNKDLISIKKSVSFKHINDYDIEMYFRIKKYNCSFDLWPIKFISKDGKSITAEIDLNGKKLINQVVQNELIELANTWGKALLAQEVKHRFQPSV